jgi:hypothetical protein
MGTGRPGCGSVINAAHRVRVLQARHARPRRILRALKRLARVIDVADGKPKQKVYADAFARIGKVWLVRHTYRSKLGKKFSRSSLRVRDTCQNGQMAGGECADQ